MENKDLTPEIQLLLYIQIRASQVALVVKNLPTNAGDLRNIGSIPGSGRYPGEGHGNPLQYSCRENPMLRGVCQATAEGVAKSWAQLSPHTTSNCPHLNFTH